MAALSDPLTVLVDCATRPGRIIARREGVDLQRTVGDRPLGTLASTVEELLDGSGIELLALVTGPGPLLPLRSAAAFVRLLAWSRGLPVVSFRSLDPLADDLAAALDVTQRGLILEPLGRNKVLQVEVRSGQAQPIDRVSVVAPTDLSIRRDDLVAGQLREEGRVRGAGVFERGVSSESSLLDYAVALWRCGAVSDIGELRAWYVKDSGVRRGFDVRLADGSIGRVGRPT
ncbi:hypothetical protein [Ferrimicrobium sp.]|uniref:hypothetical protein n=1 Tax=Ferrimicrobium sp. TaxID=2926050 RepID=UPI00261959F1|nr:hypothetical protein [Ferrimicrobium sp.]